MHADLSGQLSDAGVTVTLIHSDAHKVDGNPYAPLPDPVHARIQGEIDSIRTLFAQTVAAGRGRRLTADAALATEAPANDKTEDQAAPVEPSSAPAAPPAPAPTEAATAVALIRAEAAELATVGAQAVRLGVSIDVAEALHKGVRPDARRASVLNQLAARSDAAAIAVVPPPKSAAPESPLLAAAKRIASAGKST